jgi:hypothetical protein
MIFLSVKNDENVTSKSVEQKNWIKISWHLEGHDKRAGSGSGSGSVPKCHGSGTLVGL